MEPPAEKKPAWVTTFRWVARIVGLLFIILLLGFFIGEGRHGGAQLHGRDYFLLSMWALYIIGLVAGLKWESLGGLISLVFLFIQVIYLVREGTPTGWFFYLLVIPPVLYLLSGYLHRRYLQR